MVMNFMTRIKASNAQNALNPNNYKENRVALGKVASIDMP